MSNITTHVLDTSRGRPAAGVPVVLARRADDGSYREIGRGVTDGDGRLRTLVPAGASVERGVHRITFDTGAYFVAQGVDGFYPEASIVFEVRSPSEHHHVPLLLNPFGYSTYRGS
jgi:5-hydroxyisourate hydrolase